MKKHLFKPAWWLPNSHMQTIWPVLYKKRIKLPLVRERLELPDGDFIDLEWLDKEKAGPLVLILHGFEGSIDSHYATGMMSALREAGYRSVFMHFRGCSGEPNRLQRSYHSGDTHDAAFVVDMIMKREPNTPMAAIGYSLGGNVLLKWLGETGDKNPLKAAVAVSVPFELHKAAKRIQQGFSQFYQWYFMRCLRLRLTNKSKYVPSPVHPSEFEKIRDIRVFDHIYTAPLHGFSSGDEYYHRSSSRQFLRAIKVPTLILHAKDDPFMVQDVIPLRQEVSDHVELEISETGGHVGFVSGKSPWQPEYYLEQRIPLFFDENF